MQLLIRSFPIAARQGRSASMLFLGRGLLAVLVCAVIFPPRGIWGDAPTTIPVRRPVDVARGSQGMVVSETRWASEVGREVLEAGGNAVDAAIAVGFALAVTWPEAGNIGGGGFMLVAPTDDSRGSSTDKVVCIDYRETAPAAVSAHSFAQWKELRHARMAGVPGTVRGFALAHQQFGKLPWRQLLKPAVKLARDGFEVDDFLAYSLNTALKVAGVRAEDRYAEFRRVFAHPTRYFWKASDTLVQPDLAATLQLLAADGPDAFYVGRIAEQLVREMELGEGLISAADLREYRAVQRSAIRTDFAGFEVYGPPPPSSGGLTMSLQLKMLQRVADLRQLDQGAAEIHAVAEVMRRAFRQRAAYLGDPDFVAIDPSQFGSAAAARLLRRFDPRSATPSAALAGEIELASGPYESPQTTHFSVVDAAGLAVSNTYTLEQSFGSRIVVREAGFLLNNEMGDFNWYPGHTDATGRIGTPANQMAPGKRMLSSMTPTIVKQSGRVALVVGSPGGRTIINTVMLVTLRNLALGQSLPAAVDAPRFHHQWFPDRIVLEDLPQLRAPELLTALETRGHVVHAPSGQRQGSVHAIAYDPVRQTMVGVADWRRGGAARAAR